MARGHQGGGLPPSAPRQKGSCKCMRQRGLGTPSPLFSILCFAEKQPVCARSWTSHGLLTQPTTCPQTATVVPFLTAKQCRGEPVPRAETGGCAAPTGGATAHGKAVDGGAASPRAGGTSAPLGGHLRGSRKALSPFATLT